MTGFVILHEFFRIKDAKFFALLKIRSVLIPQFFPYAEIKENIQEYRILLVFSLIQLQKIF